MFSYGGDNMKTFLNIFSIGIKVKIDLTTPEEEQKITRVLVCNELESNQLCTDMEEEKEYQVVMYAFVAYGGDGFNDLRHDHKIHQGKEILI